MNLLPSLPELDKRDLANIGCWLWILKIPIKYPPAHHDVALLNIEVILEGARQWCVYHEISDVLTHPVNVTANTARKLFGEGTR